MPERRTEDPYAPPPMHHDRSGRLVRAAILAALIGAAGWGYMSLAGEGRRTALAPEGMEEQQVADAAYPTATEALPPAELQQTPPPAARAPARRPTSPAAPPAEPTPPPSTNFAPPTTPTPIPPVDMPPSG